MSINKVLAIFFTILTICGAVYIFYTGGKANAGFAVIPMLFSLIFSNRARSSDKSKQKYH